LNKVPVVPNKKLIIDSKNRNKYSFIEKNNRTLLIHNVNFFDSGVYFCEEDTLTLVDRKFYRIVFYRKFAFYPHLELSSFFFFLEKIIDTNDSELKTIRDNLNLIVTSTKAIARNRLSIVFQINKNDFDEIKLIYLLIR
jgi:hypothetical protein